MIIAARLEAGSDAFMSSALRGGGLFSFPDFDGEGAGPDLFELFLRPLILKLLPQDFVLGFSLPRFFFS
ncbi:uncharacterized protein CPUR_05871 [Claviceps purpurea 20.1]|uniref:Uncharacterized protein n=1 Tax=Claviceps purpurea (strain 20.1) TaxID=1111077 RepID=M1WD74_CLAP2|nr:uncharacterized protein CPUR_05871 [Claviceps purpurea 20.1]